VDFLQKLIDDLLDLAAGKVAILSHEKFEPVHLAAILERVVRRFEVPAEEKGLALEWNNLASGEEVTIQATPEGIDRIFNNLVSNAIRYTPQGGRVRVTLSHQGHEALVAVEDTGIGIPEEAMTHLFEEFYRAPNAKELEHDGTGLGLTISKDMVTRFGGNIAVKSKLSEGTKFTVTLPTCTKADRPSG
jgi:signal transduction histidine kinase